MSRRHRIFARAHALVKVGATAVQRRPVLSGASAVLLIALSIWVGLSRIPAGDAVAPAVARSAAPGGLIRSAVPGGSAPLVPFKPGSDSASSQLVADADKPYVRDRMIVAFAPQASRAEREDVIDSIGARSIKRVASTNIEVLALPAGMSVTEARAQLASASVVAYSEPDFVYEAAARIPSDPSFAKLWGLHNEGQTVNSSTGTPDADIDAPEAWDVTTGDGSVAVAIVDSGIAYDHPDIAPNMWTNAAEISGNGIDDDGNGFVDDRFGWDFVADDEDPRDQHGHGTHVAGTVAAAGDNGVGVTGVSWRARLMALRVLGVDGTGTTSDIAAAFAYASANGAQVVNASLGGPGASRALLDVIRSSPETLFVVAAGNEGKDNDVAPSYPCNYDADNIVCVAASGAKDELVGFSNFGLTSVDIAAPGNAIQSTVPAFASPFWDGFETDLSKWITGGVGGPWSRGLDAAGGYLADSASGPYQPDTNSWIQTAVATPIAPGVVCSIWYLLRLDVENGRDGLFIEDSADGSVWETIASWTGSTSGDWVRVAHDLSAQEGDSVFLRFRLKSDATTDTYGGADIDNVQIRCPSTSYSKANYAFYSGTSMASPQVAGAAALIWSARPNAHVGEIRAALLAGGDSTSSFAGRTVTGARLNVFNALTLLVPDLAPLPQAPRGDEPQPSVSTSGGPTAAPTTSPPSTSPSPTPTDAAEPDTEHARSVSLSLRRHLRASGVVSSENEACVADVVVAIKRNGVRVARVRTDGEGKYVVRLPDRPGRYVAVLSRSTTAAGDSCGSAASAVRRHHH